MLYIQTIFEDRNPEVRFWNYRKMNRDSRRMRQPGIGSLCVHSDTDQEVRIAASTMGNIQASSAPRKVG